MRACRAPRPARQRPRRRRSRGQRGQPHPVRPGRHAAAGRPAPRLLTNTSGSGCHAWRGAGARLAQQPPPEEQLQRQRDVAEGLDIDLRQLGDQPVASTAAPAPSRCRGWSPARCRAPRHRACWSARPERRGHRCWPANRRSACSPMLNAGLAVEKAEPGRDVLPAADCPACCGRERRRARRTAATNRTWKTTPRTTGSCHGRRPSAARRMPRRSAVRHRPRARDQRIGSAYIRPPWVHRLLRPRSSFSGELGADIALEDLAVIADLLDRVVDPFLVEAERLAHARRGAEHALDRRGPRSSPSRRRSSR